MYVSKYSMWQTVNFTRRELGMGSSEAVPSKAKYEHVGEPAANLVRNTSIEDKLSSEGTCHCWRRVQGMVPSSWLNVREMTTMTSWPTTQERRQWSCSSAGRAT